MAIPDSTETVADGAIGSGTDEAGDTFVVIGAASLATANTRYTLTRDDLPTLVTTLGYGDAVDLVALLLTTAGGTVHFFKPALTNGTNSAVAAGASNTSTGVVTLSGNPLDDVEGSLTVVTGGLRGAATVKVSFDGGRTYGPETATAASMVLGLGITAALTGSTATYVAGDTFSWTSAGPTYALSDLQTTMDAVVNAVDGKNQALVFGVMHIAGIVGGADDAAKAAALLAIVVGAQAKAVVHFAAHAFYRMIFDGCDVANTSGGDTALVSAFASTAADRCLVGASFCRIVSAISGRQYRRPWAWAASARAKSVGISEDLAFVGRGPVLPGWLLSIERDERTRSGLDAARFCVPRTFQGIKPGFAGIYVCNPNTMAAPGSDFALLQHCRIIDVACRTARGTMLPFLSGKIRTYAAAPNTPTGKTAGTMVEQDARNIEALAKADLAASLIQGEGTTGAPHCQDASLTVSRSAVIYTAPKTIPTTVRVQPFAYPKQITINVGFTPLTAPTA